LVENHIFHAPLAFDALLGGPVRILPCHLARKKLDWYSYPTVKKSLRIWTTIMTEYYWHVTDGQTFGRTDTLRRRSACYASITL